MEADSSKQKRCGADWDSKKIRKAGPQREPIFEIGSSNPACPYQIVRVVTAAQLPTAEKAVTPSFAVSDEFLPSFGVVLAVEFHCVGKTRLNHAGTTIQNNPRLLDKPRAMPRVGAPQRLSKRRRSITQVRGKTWRPSSRSDAWAAIRLTISFHSSLFHTNR